MKISTLFYTLRQGVRSMFRNKLFSLASVATISACLFLFGIFYSVVMNFQYMVKNAEESVSITIFFDDGTSQARMQEIGEILLHRTEVAKINFVSADEAWEIYKNKYLNGSDEGFPTNPLEGMDKYEIYLSDVSMQGVLVTYLESVPDVGDIKYSTVTANALSGVNLIIAYVSGGIILILLLVSIFLISNTVTIGISVRQEEINIMKYIGATDFFVRAPFVVEGILIGAIGAAIPLGIIHLMYNKAIAFVQTQFPSLSGILTFLSVDELFHVLVPLSFLIGVGIGFFGSFATVRKHLRV